MRVTIEVPNGTVLITSSTLSPIESRHFTTHSFWANSTTSFVLERPITLVTLYVHLWSIQTGIDLIFKINSDYSSIDHCCLLKGNPKGLKNRKHSHGIPKDGGHIKQTRHGANQDRMHQQRGPSLPPSHAFQRARIVTGFGGGRGRTGGHWWRRVRGRKQGGFEEINAIFQCMKSLFKVLMYQDTRVEVSKVSCCRSETFPSPTDQRTFMSRFWRFWYHRNCIFNLLAIDPLIVAMRLNMHRMTMEM